MDADSTRCAAELSDARVDVLGYACLVAIMSMGHGYHRESERKLSAVTADNGAPAPVVTSAGALVGALHTMGARSVTLVAPYVRPLTQTVVDYIRNEGIEVGDSRPSKSPTTCASRPTTPANWCRSCGSWTTATPTPWCSRPACRCRRWSPSRWSEGTRQAGPVRGHRHRPPDDARTGPPRDRAGRGHPPLGCLRGRNPAHARRLTAPGTPTHVPRTTRSARTTRSGRSTRSARPPCPPRRGSRQPEGSPARAALTVRARRHVLPGPPAAGGRVAALPLRPARAAVPRPAQLRRRAARRTVAPARRRPALPARARRRDLDATATCWRASNRSPRCSPRTSASCPATGCCCAARTTPGSWPAGWRCSRPAGSS